MHVIPCDEFVRSGPGGGSLRSESARLLTPEIRRSKFPGAPSPSVTLAHAAPGPLYNSAALRSVYRARPCATRRSLRSEEHTSELQSRPHLVCRLLLEKKNTPHPAPSLRKATIARPHP